MKKTLALFGGPKIRKKPFKPHPVLGRDEKMEVISVLKTGVLSGFIAKAGEAFYGGPKVRLLEKLFCREFGARHAVAMNSATSALHAALLAVGVEPGDEVLVPPYTMSASASAIVMCGGIPVFVDVEMERYCMDASKMEKLITKRTKAVLVVHLFGHPADMRRIMKIARRHKLKVVEDCAQAPGAVYHGRPVGTIGDIGVFSLNQHKTITTGEGGVAVTSNKTFALKMQLVRNHGEVVSDHLPEAKHIACLGWNYRMCEIEAAIGIAQFKKLRRLTEHRIRLAEYLTSRLERFPGLHLPRPESGSKHVYFVYPIRIDMRAAGISRDAFVKALGAEGIPFGAGYVRPIYLEPMYRKRKIYKRSHYPFSLQTGRNTRNYEKGSCPNTEYLYERGLMMTSLCRYPLRKKDMDQIIRAFAKIYANAQFLESR